MDVKRLETEVVINGVSTMYGNLDCISISLGDGSIDSGVHGVDCVLEH